MAQWVKVLPPSLTTGAPSVEGKNQLLQSVLCGLLSAE